MSNKTLPTVTSDIPRDLRNFIDRLRELLGSSGTERFVTAKELISAGVITNTVTPVTNKPTVVTVATPPSPGIITVTPAIQNILVEWARPTYVGHAYAEVWGNSVDNVNTAVKIGIAPGNVYVDPIGPSASRYYWVRFINILDVSGPFNSASGTLGQTGSDVTYMLETLSDAALSPTSPYSKFAVRADFFFVAPAMDFNQEATPTATATGDLWYKPSTGVTTVWNGSTWAAFNTTLPFIVNTTTQTINGVSVPPGVYMDAAFIKSGTITNAKIGNAAIDDAKIANLSAAKITAGFLDAARIEASSITADKITVNSLAALSFTTGALTVSDALTLNTTGHIKGGQTAFNTGTGFFLGYSDTTYKFSVGNSTSNLTWDGTSLSVQGTGKFWYPTNPGDYVSLGLDANGSTVRVYRAAPSLLPPLYIYDTATGPTTSSAWISHENGDCLFLTSSLGIAIDSYGGSATTTTVPVGSFIGSRQQAQLYVEGRKQTGSVSVHSGRFKVIEGSTIRSSAICGVDSINPSTGIYYAFYAEVGTYGPFTGSHDCLLPKTESVEQGDILVDVALIYKKDISNTLFSVTKSTAPNQCGIGVYIGVEQLVASDPPAAFMDNVNTIDEGPVYDPEGNYLYNKYIATAVPEFYGIVDGYDLAAMNAVGEGQVNVCGENGNINRGDLIVTSSMVGKGMKQADDIVRSYTVAKARESVTFASPTEVKQIACIYMCG